MDPTPLNAICFGGGGLVGTAKALGHMVGLDQLVRDPSCRGELKNSFFDYMSEAGVSLREVEARLDDVFALIPPEVRNGQHDHLKRYFKVACGISGGALLASAVASCVPLAELVREALAFPVTYYFWPDFGEYLRGLRRLPLVPVKVAKVLMDDLRRGAEARTRGGRWSTPLVRRSARLAFELLATAHDLLPRGLFTGRGIELYVEELSERHGLARTFAEVRARDRYLYIIAERFNASRHLSTPDEPDTVVYFGFPPYDTTPVSTAIRASCSIPGITTPYTFVDVPRGGRRYDLVDGAVGKTIGRARIMAELPVKLVVTVNPIVPLSGPLNNLFDHMEQLYRKLIYSRLKAVEGHLDDEIRASTLHIESRPDDFFYNMLRLDKMKEGMFEGYYQTLKHAAENYVDVSERLKRGGLCLVPRTEVFRLATVAGAIRERAYLKEHRAERTSSLGRRVAATLQSIVEGLPRRMRGGEAVGVTER